MTQGTANELLESIVASQQAAIGREVTRGVRRLGKLLELDVHLSFFDPVDDALPVVGLSPGGAVLVRVRAYPDAGDAAAVTARGAFGLRDNEMVLMLVALNAPELEIVADVGSELRTRGASSVRVSREDIEPDGVEVWFWVRSLATCARQTVVLELRAGSLAEQVVLRTKLEVLGDRLAPSHGGLSPFYLEPAAAPPKNVAFLYVNESEHETLELRGIHAVDVLTTSVRLPRGGLCLAGMTAERRSAREIVGNMFDFSRNAVPALQYWIQKLLATHAEDLILVVFDLSRAEVPWELLELPNGPYRLLGAQIEVVRWADVGAHQGRVALQLEETHRRGVTGTFLGSQPGHVEAEEEVLRSLDTRELASMEDLLLCVEEQGDLGLLYVACHGAFVRCSGETRPLLALRNLDSDSQHHLERPPIFLEVDVERVRPRMERRAFVFVNACQSGRLLRDYSGHYGLPERFLGRVAIGYVGTLADVSNRHATELGAAVLRSVANSPGGRRIAQVLRDIRRERLRTFLPLVASDDDWIRLLHAFLYVYYGSPVALLSLSANRPLAGAHAT